MSAPPVLRRTSLDLTGWLARGLLAAACIVPCSVKAAEPPAAAGSDSLHGLTRVPQGVVLVKGAEPGASDTQTPVPEGGRVGPGVYDNSYFRLRFTFPAGWTQQYEGPPPSDSGYYVLAQLQPAGPAAGTPKADRGADRGADRRADRARETSGAGQRGTVQIAARDLFFTPLPGGSVQALMATTEAALQPVYQLDQPQSPVQMAGRSFIRLAYSSAQAGLHWSVWATEIRCHLVQFVITSPDPAFIDTAVRSLQRLELPGEPGTDSGRGGGEAPVCIAGYADGAHLLQRTEPILPPGRFNPIPVRIIIGTSGEVRHVHILCAFPEQVQAINTALRDWRFKPYVLAGHPVEVETGVLFGRAR